MLSFLKELFGTFASAAIALLPDSPFSQYIASWGSLPYLSYLNWLIPFGSCIKVLSAWLLAIATFYVVMAILRWIKVVGE